MQKKIIDESILRKGLIPDTEDTRDLNYADVLGAVAPMTDADWEKGFDIEKELNITILIKDQDQSESCVGQGFSYYKAVLDAVETGKYDEVSAKAIYSQIFLPGGGAQLRDAAALLVNWGALLESIVKSHKADGSVDEKFMEDKTWITPELIQAAKNLGAKSYASMRGLGIDYFARAIKDNHGCVGGVTGTNNGTWLSLEPQPPTDATPQSALWGHCLFFGKFGIDEKGKFIATPNSWKKIGVDKLHPDGWQKLRENYFAENNHWMINPWTLVDKPNSNNVNKNMIIYKLQGSSTLYAAVGSVLIPFVTTFDIYQKDFSTAKIIELTASEFAKFTIATSNVIKAK